MFHPTTFDNLKVILEGAIYDLEHSGELIILDRKDTVDLASMSRSFLMRFSNSKEQITATMSLDSYTSQMVKKEAGEREGTYISIIFQSKNNAQKMNMQYIQQLWGESRLYDHREIISSLYGITEEIDITFDRPITEGMVDDLLEMLRHTIKTINALTS